MAFLTIVNRVVFPIVWSIIGFILLASGETFGAMFCCIMVFLNVIIGKIDSVIERNE